MPVTSSHLKQLLECFAPSDREQQSYLRRMFDLVDIDGDPADRYLFDPGHFTASGFVASPNGTDVLLIHHQKIGKWLQPGGHIEPDDLSLEHAIRREVEEETGLVAMESLGLLDIDIHQFPARGDDPAHLHFDVRFGFCAISGLVEAGDGTNEVRWIPFGEVSHWNPELSVTRPSAALSELVETANG